METLYFRSALSSSHCWRHEEQLACRHVIYFHFPPHSLLLLLTPHEELVAPLVPPLLRLLLISPHKSTHSRSLWGFFSFSLGIQC
ncbi:hypothetical protein CEXT_409481 [Caerostris extrusa]|uniref:Uncharacterized protein n=1 Tax=Caerostris extrusa TaxID=172846 RepID=A0AAV4S5K4_CAEEX|nr:hypothetical protein CEXT_409481 [Caerostris extrusa]